MGQKRPMAGITWPWPNDTREQRARRVALAYRAELERTAPERAKRLDATWTERGQGWIAPTYTPLRLDDWLTPDELADMFHVPPCSFKDWHRRGHIRVMKMANNKRLYNVGDIVNYSAARQRKGWF
jgi:hypothetical protein